MLTIDQPIVEQWYRHLDKGQQFQVTAIDDAAGTVEIQHFDGDVEELDMESWYQQEVEPIPQPEDWAGPMDNIERDDLGYAESDMTEHEGNQSVNEVSAPPSSNEEAAEREAQE